MPIKKIKKYLNKMDINVPFLIAILALFLIPYFNFAWWIAIIACFFIEEE